MNALVSMRAALGREATRASARMLSTTAAPAGVMATAPRVMWPTQQAFQSLVPARSANWTYISARVLPAVKANLAPVVSVTAMAGSIVVPPLYREVTFCAATALQPQHATIPRVVTTGKAGTGRTVLRVLMSVYFVALAVPFMLVGSLLLWLVVYPLTRPFDRNCRIAGYFFRKFFGASQALNPFWRCKLVGPIPDEAPGRTVVVSNHLSNADALLIGYLLPFEAKFVSKEEVKFLPFVGWAMWLVGDIFVGFREEQKSKDGWKATNRSSVIDKAKAYLERNHPVFIFPEGWRSPTTDLLYFKDGAFEAAIAAQANILPVALAGTDVAMPLGELMPDTADCYLTIGDYISTEGMTMRDIPVLKAKVAEAIMVLKGRVDPLAEDCRRQARIRRGVSPDSRGIVPNAESLYGRAASKSATKRAADEAAIRQSAPSA